MKFLCLHGIGTNNEIFKSQTAALRYALGSEHRYIFAQGSVPWAMAPELEGVAQESDTYFAYFDPSDASTYLEAYYQLDDFIRTEGPFDGVLAFSQGAGLAIAYMARARVEQAHAAPTFKCAILLSPTAVGDPFEWFNTGDMRRLQELPGGLKIEVPTAMIWGERDAYREQEGMEKLFELFDDATSWNYIHNGVHEVPSPKLEDSVQQTKKLAIRSMTLANHLVF
ncbi:serine hydrolase FSH [Dendryphion nanum]|uniref:Serine hydrolase FSH n=1 Tax=Dendryphion nanum TaxID=256645 RepID=A0A9P9E0P6_9PLEO|nr:serine hydrolase FSH [Dendryphion nanum]